MKDIPNAIMVLIEDERHVWMLDKHGFVLDPSQSCSTNLEMDEYEVVFINFTDTVNFTKFTEVTRISLYRDDKLVTPMMVMKQGEFADVVHELFNMYVLNQPGIKIAE